MNSPELILIGIIAASAVLASFLVIYQRKNQRGRVLIEDALKHLYHCSTSGIPFTMDGLAGALGRPADEAATVLNGLTEKHLVRFEGSDPVLTDEGREYALRIIRVHRLWERHLADETTVRELDWHKEADRREHHLSTEEVHSLSKRLGHPVYDPHGDPIPTPEGNLPTERGKSVDQFADGTTVHIVHVEDEPESVYAELVAAGLHPGMIVTIGRRTRDHVILVREGEEVEISHLAAANLRVRREKDDRYTGERKTLASLDPGATATVQGLSPACRGIQRRRLMDLGLVPGTTVTALMRSPGGDPTAYKIRGASIALRKQQASCVFVE